MFTLLERERGRRKFSLESFSLERSFSSWKGLHFGHFVTIQQGFHQSNRLRWSNMERLIKGKLRWELFFEKKNEYGLFWTLEKYFEIFVSDLWPLMILWQPHWGKTQLFIQKFLGIWCLKNVKNDILIMWILWNWEVQNVIFGLKMDFWLSVATFSNGLVLLVLKVSQELLKVWNQLGRNAKIFQGTKKNFKQ